LIHASQVIVVSPGAAFGNVHPNDGQPRSRKYRLIGRSVNPASSYAAREAGVATGLDHGDVHSLASHVVDRNLSEPRADTAPLLGIDADDVDHGHAFVEGIQRDGDETDRASVRDGDEDVSVTAHTARSHGRSLVRLPVRVQAEKYVIAENVSHGREHRRLGAKRELDDRIEVVP
jgi:hypothetical protein